VVTFRQDAESPGRTCIERVTRTLPMPNSGIKNLKSKIRLSLCLPLLSKRRLGLTGLEPVTLRLSSACSNQLSYRPVAPAKQYLRSKIERRRVRIPLI
jgi:hypothetical protein